MKKAQKRHIPLNTCWEDRLARRNSFHVSSCSYLGNYGSIASSCSEITDRKLHRGKDFAFHLPAPSSSDKTSFRKYEWEKQRDRKEKGGRIEIGIQNWWNILFFFYLSPNGIEPLLVENRQLGKAEAHKKRIGRIKGSNGDKCLKRFLETRLGREEVHPVNKSPEFHSYLLTRPAKFLLILV